MLYTYDITDVKTGEIVARDITKRKVGKYWEWP